MMKQIKDWLEYRDPNDHTNYVFHLGQRIDYLIFWGGLILTALTVILCLMFGHPHECK